MQKKKSFLQTWMVEACVVFIVLATVAMLTGNRLVEWIGTFAVFGTFLHAQVADRMQEKQAIKITPDVHCFRWSTRYFVCKELLWFVYFFIHQSYAALVGVILFLLYPFWRTWWRRRYPLSI